MFRESNTMEKSCIRPHVLISTSILSAAIMLCGKKENRTKAFYILAVNQTFNWHLEINVSILCSNVILRFCDQSQQKKT